MSFFTRKPRKVLVLGAGPAGLLAAYAAESKGYEVAIFSAPDGHGRAAKSTLYGCQYLHSAIPGLTAEAGRTVRYELVNGTAGEYRRKVYGNGWTGQVSPDEYGPERTHQAWDLRRAYDMLWDRFAMRIVPMNITAEMAGSFGSDPNDMVISTIPPPLLCRRDEHKFPTQDVWAMGSLNEEDGRMPYCAPNMTVMCNAADAPRWYRAATVFGHSTLEWPQGAKPPITGVAAVSKPLSTDCDCQHGRRWLRVGRYGKWTKGVLVHTAYFDTLEKL
jgi:FAD binding domain-containing protein